MDVKDILSNDRCYLDLISLPTFAKHCGESTSFGKGRTACRTWHLGAPSLLSELYCFGPPHDSS